MKKMFFRHWTIGSTGQEKGNKQGKSSDYPSYSLELQIKLQNSNRSEIGRQKQFEFEGYSTRVEGGTHRESSRELKKGPSNS